VIKNVQSKCAAGIREASGAADQFDVLAGDVPVDIRTALFEPGHGTQTIGESGTCQP
jgi:hypothetical protein